MSFIRCLFCSSHMYLHLIWLTKICCIYDAAKQSADYLFVCLFDWLTPHPQLPHQIHNQLMWVRCTTWIYWCPPQWPQAPLCCLTIFKVVELTIYIKPHTLINLKTLSFLNWMSVLHVEHGLELYIMEVFAIMNMTLNAIKIYEYFTSLSIYFWDYLFCQKKTWKLWIVHMLAFNFTIIDAINI